MYCWRDIKDKKLSNEEIISLLKKDHILKEFSKCIKCNDSRIFNSRKNMIKCKSCHLEWSIRTGSMLADSKLTFEKFIILYSLFLEEHSSYKASRISNVNKNTANKFFKKFKILKNKE